MASSFGITFMEIIKKALFSVGSQEHINFMKNHSMKPEDFYDLIEKREKEHKEEVREARQRDLIRIQDMTSKTGLEPLQLFPKEIWMMLLNEILPQDKLNFRRVHETFCDLTEDQVISGILLPLILKCCKVDRVSKGKHTVCICLPLAECTELRAVSKSLRNAVDRWFEDDLITNLNSKNQHSCPSEILTIELNDLEDHKKVCQMKTELSNPSVSKSFRFFTRSFEVESYYDDQDIEMSARVSECCKNIYTILECIGNQVWYFSFDFGRWFTRDRQQNSEAFESLYTSLMGWLSKMPNLKWLKLIIDGRDKSCKFRIGTGTAQAPTLAHLQRLDLELIHDRDECFPGLFEDFISANPQVKTLNLVGFASVLGLVCMSKAKKCQSLENLCIEGLIESDDLDYLVKSIANPVCSLKRIRLNVNMEKKSVYCIFKSLEAFQTLEMVCLSVEDASIGDDTSFLKLPQLTHFEFRMKHSYSFEDYAKWKIFFTFQFPLFAKTLNVLKWECTIEGSAWENFRHNTEFIQQFYQMPDFHDDFCDVKNSTTWRVFPWLETLFTEVVIDKQVSFAWKFSRDAVKDITEQKQCLINDGDIN